MNFKLTAAFLISVFSIQFVQAQSTRIIGHVNGSGAVAYVAPTSENITPLVIQKLKGK